MAGFSRNQAGFIKIPRDTPYAENGLSQELLKNFGGSPTITSNATTTPNEEQALLNSILGAIGLTLAQGQDAYIEERGPGRFVLRVRDTDTNTVLYDFPRDSDMEYLINEDGGLQAVARLIDAPAPVTEKVPSVSYTFVTGADGKEQMVGTDGTVFDTGITNLERKQEQARLNLSEKQYKELVANNAVTQGLARDRLKLNELQEQSSNAYRTASLTADDLQFRANLAENRRQFDVSTQLQAASLAQRDRADRLQAAFQINNARMEALDRAAEILRNPSDYIARGYALVGKESPVPFTSQADLINAVSFEYNALNDYLNTMGAPFDAAAFMASVPAPAPAPAQQNFSSADLFNSLNISPPTQADPAAPAAPAATAPPAPPAASPATQTTPSFTEPGLVTSIGGFGFPQDGYDVGFAAERTPGYADIYRGIPSRGLSEAQLTPFSTSLPIAPIAPIGFMASDIEEGNPVFGGFDRDVYPIINQPYQAQSFGPTSVAPQSPRYKGRTSTTQTTRDISPLVESIWGQYQRLAGTASGGRFEHGGVTQGFGNPIIVGDSSDDEENQELVMSFGNAPMVVLPLNERQQAIMEQAGNVKPPRAENGGAFDPFEGFQGTDQFVTQEDIDQGLQPQENLGIEISNYLPSLNLDDPRNTGPAVSSQGGGYSTADYTIGGQGRKPSTTISNDQAGLSNAFGTNNFVGFGNRMGQIGNIPGFSQLSMGQPMTQQQIIDASERFGTPRVSQVAQGMMPTTMQFGFPLMTPGQLSSLTADEREELRTRLAARNISLGDVETAVMQRFGQTGTRRGRRRF